MKLKGRSYFIRRTHRYLGVFIGIQFLLWTLGGLYFSWTQIETIRGEHLYQPAAIRSIGPTIPLSDALSGKVGVDESVDLAKMRVVTLLGEVYYSVVYIDRAGDERRMLLRANDGNRRGPITESEARQIAVGAINEPVEVESVEFITKEMSSGHHEYREKPLPAWAVNLRHGEGATAYIGADDGQIHAVRTNGWRAFDFLWMLHTMDFAGRDNINNYLLRSFSILGIVTVFSGFLLFFVSSRNIRRLLRDWKRTGGSAFSDH